MRFNPVVLNMSCGKSSYISIYSFWSELKRKVRQANWNKGSFNLYRSILFGGKCFQWWSVYVENVLPCETIFRIIFHVWSGIKIGDVW